MCRIQVLSLEIWVFLASVAFSFMLQGLGNGTGLFSWLLVEHPVLPEHREPVPAEDAHPDARMQPKQYIKAGNTEGGQIKKKKKKKTSQKVPKYCKITKLNPLRQWGDFFFFFFKEWNSQTSCLWIPSHAIVLFCSKHFICSTRSKQTDSHANLLCLLLCLTPTRSEHQASGFLQEIVNTQISSAGRQEKKKKSTAHRFRPFNSVPVLLLQQEFVFFLPHSC